jgi:hypothetical protein
MLQPDLAQLALPKLEISVPVQQSVQRRHFRNGYRRKQLPNPFSRKRKDCALNNKHGNNHPHNQSGSHKLPPACRLVGYLVGKFREYRANKEKDTAQEKSARVTAFATIWIALFTFVLAGASR